MKSNITLIVAAASSIIIESAFPQACPPCVKATSCGVSAFPAICIPPIVINPPVDNGPADVGYDPPTSSHCGMTRRARPCGGGNLNNPNCW